MTASLLFKWSQAQTFWLPKQYHLQSLSSESAALDFRFSFFSAFRFFRSARSSGVSPSFLFFFLSFLSSPFVCGFADTPASPSTISPVGATGGAERTSARVVRSAVPLPVVRGPPGPSLTVSSSAAL